jgi:hypothetical protein
MKDESEGTFIAFFLTHPSSFIIHPSTERHLLPEGEGER